MGIRGKPLIDAYKERTYVENLIATFGMEAGDSLYEMGRRTSDFYFKREKLMRKGNYKNKKNNHMKIVKRI